MSNEGERAATTTEIAQAREQLAPAQFEAFLLRCLDAAETQARTQTQAEALLAVAAYANELGSFYRGAARCAEGERMFLRALDALEQAEGRTERFAICAGNLAELYRLDGRLDDCERLLKQAEALFQDCGSVEFAACLNYQGHAKMARGDYDQAGKLYARGLEITRICTPGTIEEATAFQNAANAHLQAGKLDQAQELLQQALAVYDDNALGINAHYIGLLNALGATAARRGELQAAADWFGRATDALDTCAVNPLDEAIVCLNAGSVFVRAGYAEKARRMAQRIRELSEIESLHDDARLTAALESSRAWL